MPQQYYYQGQGAPTSSLGGTNTSQGANEGLADANGNSYQDVVGAQSGSPWAGTNVGAGGLSATSQNYTYGGASSAPSSNLSANPAGSYGSGAFNFLPSSSSSYYDPGASSYAYGGTAEPFFDGQAADAENRGTTTIATDQTNSDLLNSNIAEGQQGSLLSQQQNAYGTQAAALGQQQQGVNFAQAQASGTAPSVAQAQLQSGMGQANNAAASTAANARGSGTGLAQILASQQQSANQLGTNNQAAQLRASEIQQGTNAYNSALQGQSASANALGATASGISNTEAGIRTQDQNQQTQDAQQAQAQASATQAGLNENDTQASREQALGQQASQSTQQGNIDYESNEGQNYNAQSATNAGISEAGAQTATSVLGAGLGALGTIAAVASDARAKTGIQSLTIPAPGYQYQYTPSTITPVQPATGVPGPMPGPNAMPTMDPQPTHVFGSDPSEVAAQPGGQLATGGPMAGGAYGQGQWNQQRALTNTTPGTAANPALGNALRGAGNGLGGGASAFAGGLASLLMGRRSSSPAATVVGQGASPAPAATPFVGDPSADAGVIPSDVNLKTGVLPLTMQQAFAAPMAAGANQSSPGNALSPASYGAAAQHDHLAQPVAPSHPISNAQAARLSAQADAMQRQMTYQYGGAAGVAPPAGDPNPQVGSFLDSLHPYAFRYKDPRLDPTDPGEHYGVMAQNVASTPMGASLIDRAKGGGLAIDMKRAVPAALAGEADLNQRVKQLEAQLAAQTGANSPGIGSTTAAYRYGGR